MSEHDSDNDKYSAEQLLKKHYKKSLAEDAQRTNFQTDPKPGKQRHSSGATGTGTGTSDIWGTHVRGLRDSDTETLSDK